jgi:ubiquinone/menaquinone biosynthesis C-methylase UbiE
MRSYRIELQTGGQKSPEYLNKHVRDVLEILITKNSRCNIVDVGCGIGFQCELLKKHYPNLSFTGVDFSEATINYLKNSTSMFDKIIYASSSLLPIKDKEYDISLSMENLEHLYYEEVLDAFKEFQRISKIIIITTPTPNRVVNVRWLSDELSKAINDDIPIDDKEYPYLESCVHKSTILPRSLIDAGFKQIQVYNTESECYFVESDLFDITKLKFVGIKKEDLSKNNNKDKYISLLNESLNLNNKIRELK